MPQQVLYRQPRIAFQYAPDGFAFGIGYSKRNGHQVTIVFGIYALVITLKPYVHYAE